MKEKDWRMETGTVDMDMEKGGKKDESGGI